MPDYPPGYDPGQAGYISAGDQAIGGLIGLSAFAAIGIGAFFAAGAGLGTSFVYNGTTYYGVVSGVTSAEAQAAILQVLTAEGMSGEGAALLELLAESWGLESMSVEALLALGDYGYFDFEDDWDDMTDWFNDWFNNDDCSFKVGDYCLE